MPLILPGNVATATAATGYDVANSVRMNDDDTPYFNKTPSAGDRAKWTFSCWFKLGNIPGASSTHGILVSGGASADQSTIRIDGQVIDWVEWDQSGSATQGRLITNRVFRDPTAWYHLVCTWDSDNGTEGSRMKMYINGVRETSFSTGTYPTSGYDSAMNSNVLHEIGRQSWNSSQYFDGYFAEMAFCDGQAYAASDFGEFDSDSPTIWKPKDISGLTFGSRGWYLDFEDSGDLDDDESGNGNDWTANNLAAADQCIDSPTNNLCTLNPLHMSDPSSNYFVDNGNNTLEATNNDVDRQTGMTIHPQGIKGYFEWNIPTDSNFRVALQADGVGLSKNNYTALSSGQFYGLDSSGHLAYANGGSSTTLISGYVTSQSVGDVCGCAFDFTGSNRNVWFHTNGTYGNNGSGVGVPATGAYPGLTSTQLSTTKEFEFVFAVNTGGSSSSIALNFGNGSFDGTAISSAGTNASFGSFEYNVPSGFGPICTKTLNGTYS
jgi:hypothetical protein